MHRDRYDILVIGGGHAGAEAAWAAANLGAEVAMITMDPARSGQMSCNPAIGGLAKGQMVREIDALGGLMGLAADATGIQFRLLNASKGPAVRGPRCQSDKYAYAKEVQRLLGTRENLTVLAGTVERVLVESGCCAGVLYKPNPQVGPAVETADCCGEFGAIDSADKPLRIHADAVVLTTGTFMRGLMHRGEAQTPGGRVGEKPAEGISAHLRELGLELGRLKTGTPPRLAAETLDFDAFETQPGDEQPTPFSEMSALPDAARLGHLSGPDAGAYENVLGRFPRMEQANCWITWTDDRIHDLIRDNLHRAPMYNGQVETAGPRYCPSIEDKVVRFAEKHRHHVFLEPESLESNEVYCNGISTSLPEDVQERMVRMLPGCERARILRHGYAVEYDMVLPHQIDATGMVKRLPGFFLAGQINGTTGYEEAAGQGVVAGLNAVRFARDEEPVRLGRDEAYIGVLMDDLVTKVPREPYRMFTSRAEHRLMLRSDNAADRLTPLARELGLVDDARWAVYQQRAEAMATLREHLRATPAEGAASARQLSLYDWLRRPEASEGALLSRLNGDPLPAMSRDPRAVQAVVSEVKYAGFIERHQRQNERIRKLESQTLPTDVDYRAVTGLRNEARQVLEQFRPATLGQAGRLAGINPADLTVLAFALDRR